MATETGREATALLRDYLDAVDRRDALALAETIRPGGVYMIPSLGDAIHNWRDRSTGVVNLEAISESLAYVEAAETTIDVSACTSHSSVVSGRATATCEFTVRSTLLDLYGASGDDGSVTAQVMNGVIESVRLDRGPSIDVWRSLEPLPQVEDWLDRLFDPNLAAKYISVGNAS